MTKTLNMYKSMSCGNILDECTKGNFQKTLDYINFNLEGKITNRIAIKILINCCNACVYRKNDISEELLFNVIKGILPFLRDLNEADFLSYVQSLYHVIKFLINKGSLHIIIQMEDILISDFQPAQLSKKQHDAFLCIAKLLQNVIAKSALNGSENSEELFFQLSILTLNLCAKILDVSMSINLVASCFKSLIYMKVGVSYQIEYYKKLLLSFDFNQVQPKCENMFKHIQYFSSTVLNNIISTYEFEKGEEFLDLITSHIKNVLKSEEYIHFQQVLRYFLIPNSINKSSVINKCTESLMLLDTISERVDCRKELSLNLGKLLRTIQDYYCSNPKEWSNFSEILQLQMFKFITKVYLFHTSERSNGDLNENMYTGLLYSKVIFSLIKLYVTHNRHSSSDYHEMCIEIFGMFFKNIDFLKKNNFEQWGNAWNTVAIEIYNIGVNLYQHTNIAIAKRYFCLLLQYYIAVEDIRGPIFMKYSALLSTCSVLTEIHSKDSKKALGFIALSVFLCKEDSGSFMSKWITVKHNLRDDEDIHQLTLVSALKEIHINFPEFNVDNSDETYLLNLELDYYKRKWKSRIPIISVLKALLKVSDLEKMSETIVKMFIDIDLPNHDELHNILTDILNNYKLSEKSIVCNINLAVLYYLHYKSCHKKIISKNAEEMERVIVTPLIVETNSSHPLDPSDDPDIASSFENLKLDVFTKNLSTLELSLDTFDSLVPKLEIDYKHVTLLQLYKLLLTISSEFKLSCFKLKAVHSLELALKIAQVLSNIPCIIETISLIIELLDLNHDRSQALVNLADDLMKNKDFVESGNLELCIMYYICKSKALLYNSYEESYNIFKKAKELMKLAEENSNLGIIKSQLFLLNSKFSMLPCNFGVENHEKSILMDAYSATEIMFEVYRNTKLDDPYKISLLMQASNELIRLYHYLKCPREVRTYAKEILLLTQKLVLPLHSASYLMYLAHADLLSNYQDDCQVKVADMATILSLNLTNVEASGTTFLKQSSSSSPRLRAQSFLMPCFIEHKKACNCYYCDCSEYQKLVLENIRLSALINVKENNFILADDFFQGALKLYESYSQKSKNENFVHEFLTSYGYILLNYSSHLWRTGCKDEARKMNNKLLELMKGEKLVNVHLYNELLVQKLGFLTEDEIPEPIPELQVKMDNLSVSNNSDVQKTPETKQSKVSVVVEHAEIISPQKLKIKKCLPLSFSPTETEYVKRPLKYNEKTQSPKIEIYTEALEKKSRRRMNSNLIEKSNTPKIQIFTAASEKKTRSKMNASSKLQMSCSTSSGTSVAVESLKTRTKLLTEKLRKKTDPPVSNIENQDQCNKQSIVRKYPARKNLMMELTDSDHDQKSKGAVRKSSRTKNFSS